MTRLTAEHRRAQIVDAARKLSYEGGLYDWTLRDVAEHIGTSRSTVRHYFPSVLSLRTEIITGAIRERDVPIVVQALAKVDPLVADIKPALRRACAEHMAA